MNHTPALKYALLFLALCLLLTSCGGNFAHGGTTDNNGIVLAADGLGSVKYYDGCLYFCGPGTQNKLVETLWRYNISTGLCSTVCADSICTHDTKDCPFFAMDGNFYVSENCVYFERTFAFDSEPYYDFVRYEIKNAQLKQYFKAEDIARATYTRELYVGGYRFYYKNALDRESGEYTFSLHRMNLATGAEIELSQNGRKTGLDTGLLFAIDQKLYFSDGRSIFSSDFEMKNISTVLTGTFMYTDIYTDGTYIYWGEGEEKNVQTLYRAPLEGGDKTPLGITASKWQVSSDHIYYLDANACVVGQNAVSQMSGESITIPSSSLRHARLDGSDDIVIMSLVGETCYEVLSLCCVGNTVYLSYNSYRDANGDGAIDDSEIYQSIDKNDFSIMRVSTENVSVEYIRCENPAA